MIIELQFSHGNFLWIFFCESGKPQVNHTFIAHTHIILFHHKWFTNVQERKPKEQKQNLKTHHNTTSTHNRTVDLDDYYIYSTLYSLLSHNSTPFIMHTFGFTSTICAFDHSTNASFFLSTHFYGLVCLFCLFCKFS